MPTEAAHDQAGGGSAPADALLLDAALDERTRSRLVARLGVGVTLTFLIAMAFDWTLSYLAPSFAAMLLQARSRPTLKMAATVLLVSFMLMLGCYLLAGFARIYPPLFQLALIPLLFWTFRYSLRGGTSLFALLILLGLMLLPMAAKVSPQLSWESAASFVWNIALALAVAAFMYMLLPPLRSEPAPVPKPALPEAEAIRRAWIMALITGSFTIVYYSFDWTNVHTPLYIAIYIMQLSLASTLTATKGILGANIVAGVIAMLLYMLIVMVPNFVFMAVLVLLVMLQLSRLIFSDKPWAPLAGLALSSTMILLGSAMGSYTDDGGDMFLDRMGELGAAALYAVAALYVFEALWPSTLRQQRVDSL